MTRLVDPVCGVSCLPHNNGDIPLSALPEDTTSKLAGLFSTLYPFCAERHAWKLKIPFFKVFWYDLILEANPRYENCEADSPTQWHAGVCDLKN